MLPEPQKGEKRCFEIRGVCGRTLFMKEGGSWRWGARYIGTDHTKKAAVRKCDTLVKNKRRQKVARQEGGKAVKSVAIGNG